MSRTDMPCAYSEMIMSSRPPATRPARLGISSGSNVPARSRGTASAHRPDPGLHRLGDGAVAGVPRVMPGRVVLAVAQVRGQLGLQRPLQHRLDQLAEHRALAGQPQPAGRVLRPFQQRVQQPVIHQLPQRHPPGTSGRPARPGLPRHDTDHPRPSPPSRRYPAPGHHAPRFPCSRTSPLFSPRVSGCPRPAYDYPVLLLYTPRVIPPVLFLGFACCGNVLLLR